VSDSETAQPISALPGPPDGGLQPRRRRRWVLQAVIAVVILGAAAIVIAGILNAQAATVTQLTHTKALGPANMASGGLLVQQGANKSIVATRTPAVRIGHTVPTNDTKLGGTVHIVEYVDLQCPYCLQFEETNLNNVASWVESGEATLEVHPIAFLDRSSEGTRYSSRADNAVACVANYEPDAFLKSLAVLYEYQPAEGSSGLTNATILSYLKKADAASAAITKCVDTEHFRKWVAATTDEVETGTYIGVATIPSAWQGTPTVFVNGQQYAGSLTDAATFTSFVNAESTN
jgi:protein-disulfide isomerase